MSDPKSKNRTEQDLSTVILPHRSFKAWPTHEQGGRALYLPLGEALTREWEGHAHFAAYHVPTVLRRLDKQAIHHISSGVTMHLAIYDIDCPAVHRATGGDGKSPASDEWWQEQLARFQQLPPGFFAYRTRGGARLIWRRSPVIILREDKDADAWAGLYVRECTTLAAAHGIVPDPKCRPWGNLFMLPHATREGNAAPERYETFGDPSVPGAFDLPYEPGYAETARELARDQKSWREALQYLGAKPARQTAEQIRERAKAGPAPEGSRHSQVNGASLSVARQGGSRDQRLEAARSVNASLEKPIPDKDIVRYVDWTVSRFPTKAGGPRLVQTPDVAYKKMLASIENASHHFDITAIAAPTALGKTEAFIHVCIERANSGKETIVAVPRVQLMFEFRARLERAMKARGVTHSIDFHRSLGTVQAADGTYECKKKDFIAPLSAAGLYTARTLCQPKGLPNCEFYNGCKARELTALEQETGTIIITTHASLLGVANQYKKARILIDEMPPCFEAFTLKQDILYKDLFDLFTPAYTNASLAFFNALYEKWKTGTTDILTFEDVVSAQVKAFILACRSDEADSTLAPLLTDRARAYLASGRPDILERVQHVVAFMRHAEEITRLGLKAWFGFDYHREVPEVSLSRPSHFLTKIREMGRHVTVVSADAGDLALLERVGMKIEMVDIQAQPIVEHDFTWIHTQNALQSNRLFPKGIIDEEALLRCLRALAKQSKTWAGKGHKTGLFVCSKKLETYLREVTRDDATLDTKQRMQVAAVWSQLPIKYEMAHFPLSGLDCYKHLDVCFIMGDYIVPPLQSELLGMHVQQTTSEHINRVACENHRQALGRLRELRSERVKGLCIMGAHCPPERLAGATMETFKATTTPKFDPATAQLLRDYINSQKMTQDEAANYFDVSQSLISKWLSCAIEVPADVVVVCTRAPK